MNKSMLIGVIGGVAVATATAGIAGYALLDDESDATAANAEYCYEVETRVSGEPRDDKRIAGTVIGALVGGAVGRDVGDRDATTAAGAAAGAIVGNQAQKKFQENREETVTEVVCEPR